MRPAPDKIHMLGIGQLVARDAGVINRLCSSMTGNGVDAMLDRPQFSYRQDKAVPSFSDDGPRTVMDAHCGLCSAGAGWIARNDHQNEFRIIPMQSALGGALLEHYGLDAADPTSWLYIEDGRAYESLDAVIRVATRLGGRWRSARVLQVLPKPLQNFAYRVVAQNRYRIAGKTDLCTTQDPEIKKRLLL